MAGEGGGGQEINPNQTTTEKNEMQFRQNVCDELERCSVTVA